MKLSAGEARTATTAKVPLRSIAMSQGRLNWASVPTPSRKPAVLPANVVVAPVLRLTWRIRWLPYSCGASWEGHAERGASQRGAAAGTTSQGDAVRLAGDRGMWRCGGCRPGTHGDKREVAVRGDRDTTWEIELGAGANAVDGALGAAASDGGGLPSDNVGRRGRGRGRRWRRHIARPTVRAVGAVRAAASGGTISAILAVFVFVISASRSRCVLAARVRAEHWRRGWRRRRRRRGRRGRRWWR